MIFLEWLAKFRATSEMYIELRGEYDELITIKVTVVCFLPGRAKDLSATLAFLLLRHYSTLELSKLDTH
jgi:hypothetical protein